MTSTRSVPEQRRLRIAMLGHKGIPAAHGGIERHVDEIARRLAARGHQVEVFNRPYHPFREAWYEGVRVHRRPSLPTKHLDAATHTAWCAVEALIAHRFDLVHVHGIGPGLAVELTRHFKPTVFTFHAQDWRQRKWGAWSRRVLRWGEARAVRGAHAVITVSQLLADYVEATYGRRAEYIPNGAAVRACSERNQLSRWGLEADSYLLFVGRLITDRGLLQLLEAWSSIESDKRLVIVGDVQHDHLHVDELRHRADSRVVFTGYQNGAVLDQLYAHAYACVHPSEVEGLPIAVLEAMGHGRAVLVSDIPENLAAIGDAGLQFRVRDTGALRSAIERMLRQPERVSEIGARARERVAIAFDWDRIAAATEAVYERVCGMSGAGPNRLHPPAQADRTASAPGGGREG
jgi:glycosyltransferase involved in cell wall biosynthesis